MIKMTALKAIRYAGKQLKVGEEFSAKGRTDAKLLQAVGHARIGHAPAPAPAPAAKRPAATEVSKSPAYMTRHMVAETPSAPAPHANVSGTGAVKVSGTGALLAALSARRADPPVVDAADPTVPPATDTTDAST